MHGSIRPCDDHRRMLRSIKRRVTYANVVATLALVFAMSGGALAAHHYLVNSVNQINPKVVKKLKGKKGARGRTGATGATGATGPAGKDGKDGAAGPGASELAFKLPASTTPSFSKVGSAAGISLEAKCEEDGTTHDVTLDMTYTSTTAISLIQSEFSSYNEKPTTTGTSAFSIPATSTPEFWVHFSAEKGKTSIERFNGNYISPKLIYSEGYVARGGPGGECEAAIGFTPAS
jgi:hypothetical protein